MTDEQFTTFIRRVFITFPDLYEWLNTNSPDPKATQSIWRDTLRPYTLEESLLVLSDMSSGKRPIFKPYERAQFALIVRSSIEFDRDKARQRSKTVGASDEYVKVRRDKYKPILADAPELAPLYREFLDWQKSRDMQTLTENERKAKIAELVAKITPKTEPQAWVA